MGESGLKKIFPTPICSAPGGQRHNSESHQCPALANHYGSTSNRVCLSPARGDPFPNSSILKSSRSFRARGSDELKKLQRATVQHLIPRCIDRAANGREGPPLTTYWLLDLVSFPPAAQVVVGLPLIPPLFSLCGYGSLVHSIVLASAPGRGDMDFSAYRVSRRVYKCTTREIDGYHRMCSRFVSAENQYPVVPSSDLIP